MTIAIIIAVFLGIDIILTLVSLVMERIHAALRREQIEIETELNHAILEFNRRLRKEGGGK